jgi:hypothetical protein
VVHNLRTTALLTVSRNISKQYVIPNQIDQPELLPDREYLINGMDDPIVQAYHSYQVDSAVLYGARQICAELQMKEVVEFEFALANVRIFLKIEFLVILNFCVNF